MCPKCSRKMIVLLVRLAEGKIWVQDKCESCDWTSLEYYTEDQPTRDEYINLLEELVTNPERDFHWQSETDKLLTQIRKRIQ